MDKRGQQSASGWWVLIIFGVIIGAMILFDVFSDTFTLLPGPETFNLPSIGFENAFEKQGFEFFNYIFGPIPGYLDSIVENHISIGIIMIAIWIIFLLIFVDIFRLFSFFSRPVNILIALLLVIIMANVKGLSYITVYFLTILSIFGGLSILLSIGMVLMLFVMFHFGSQSLRGWVQARRTQDMVFRAQVAAGEAAAGAEFLREMGKNATKRSK